MKLKSKSPHLLHYFNRSIGFKTFFALASKNDFNTYNSKNWKPDYKPTRNPIVLCHGLFGFDKIGINTIPFLQYHYWQGLSEAFDNLGAQYYIAKVSSTGSIAQRAHELHELLENKFHGKEINLVGHSMGGLDGRYLISHIGNKSYKVGSLTTISTPHRGSSFMDWCRDTLKLGYYSDSNLDRKKIQRWYERLVRIIDIPAYSNLTTDYCINKFNPATPDDPNVAYYSYNAYTSDLTYYNSYYFPWTIVNQREGPNDGVVSLKSAEWGQLVETLHADHLDLVSQLRFPRAFKGLLGEKGIKVSKTNPTIMPRTLLKTPDTKFSNMEFYLRVSTFLRYKGF